MGNQRKIYGAGAVNIDEPRSNFPFSLHRNLSKKHSSGNMLYQYAKPWALFRYGTMVIYLKKTQFQQHVAPICQTLGLAQIWYHGSLALEECRKRNKKEKDRCKI